jgi:hypothetical protein
MLVPARLASVPCCASMLVSCVSPPNGAFGVIPPFSRLRDLLPVASGCNHGAQ